MRIISVAVALSMSIPASAAEPTTTNYDEAKVPAYTLPDPLVGLDGAKVADAETWRTKRRPELLELFRSQMHGRSPARPTAMTFDTESVEPKALGGLATRKQITIRVASDAPPIHLLLYVPNTAQKPVPVFLGINFDGNHTIDADPGIKLVAARKGNGKAGTAELVMPEESTRGASAGRWQLPLVLGRGYAVATLPRADVEPDYPEGWRHGIRGYYLKKSGRDEFAPDDWGAIAAWAWSLSRALDYLETDADVNAKQVAVHGHSRLGKASLCAGAEDERFAIVISNNSGEGGAALARRRFGETTAVINRAFPHWFCGNFKQYSEQVDKLPFDQHELMALSAPRPLYVASAVEDQWADPNGEFLSLKHAQPVYALFGKASVGFDGPQPPIDSPVGETCAYHIRTGKHDVTEYDWQQYLNFADRHFGAPRKSADGR